jgi:hypothetical protein
LLDELYDYLPHMGGLLQEFCDRGVPCESSLRELSNLVMDAPNQTELSGRFEVRFTESVCLNSPEPAYTEPVTATVRFVIDLEMGDIALEAQPLPALER